MTVGRRPLLGMLIMAGRQYVTAVSHISGRSALRKGSPPLMVNQNGLEPIDLKILANSSAVRSSCLDRTWLCQIKQVRHLELHVLFTLTVTLIGPSLGRPKDLNSLRPRTYAPRTSFDFKVL